MVPSPIQDLTRKIGLSARQLERSFNVVFGMSPGRFYRKLRVKRARVFLEETQMCLADVASATGFASTSTLSKAFRDVYNESPNEMRIRNKIQLLDYCADSWLV